MNCALAFAVLLQTVINAALIAQVQHNIADGYIVPSGYIIARYVVFATISICFILLLTKKQIIISGLAFIASFLTLPVIEMWTGRVFPVCFTAALLTLLFGGMWVTAITRKELISSISRLSVKQAMDSLDTAVLFYKKNGHILMQNNKMQELMLWTAGRAIYNCKLYLETTVIPNSEQIADDSYLYHVVDSVWQFTIKEIRLGKMPITQITADDVTEQYRENLLLQKKHLELNAHQAQLNVFARNIEENCRSENLLRIKTELHDAHNTKLTALLQYLRYGELPEGETFDEIRKSVLRGTENPKAMAASPSYMIETIVNHYGRIGVKIHIRGELPLDRDIALAFVQIFQEATVNSIAHGYANEIYAEISHNDKNFVMRITDNSTLSEKEIKEGGGIASMRRQTEKLSGCLTVGYMPGFTLSASVPEKEVEMNG